MRQLLLDSTDPFIEAGAFVGIVIIAIFLIAMVIISWMNQYKKRGRLKGRYQHTMGKSQTHHLDQSSIDPDMGPVAEKDEGVPIRPVEVDETTPYWGKITEIIVPDLEAWEKLDQQLVSIVGVERLVFESIATNKQKIALHLLHYRLLDSAEAEKWYNIPQRSISKRIHDLKMQGWKIRTINWEGKLASYGLGE